MQDRLEQEILAHKLTKAKIDTTTQTRIDVYISTTQKRIEGRIAEVEKKNMDLMREKIVLNGRIAELTGLLDDALNANKIYSDQIVHEDQKLNKLFRVIAESPMKGGGKPEEDGRDFFTISQRDPRTGEFVNDNQST